MAPLKQGAFFYRYWIICVIAFIITLTSCTRTEESPLEIAPIPLVLSTAVTTYNRALVNDNFLLVSPLGTTDSYLLNKQGFPVKKWSGNLQAHTAHLDHQGGLYRNLIIGTGNQIGGAAGGLEYFDASGNKIWEWYDVTLKYIIHHDFIVLPNGNVIVSAYERRSLADAQLAGHVVTATTGAAIISDVLLEIQRGPNNTATIVWKWDVWDHLAQEVDNSKNNFMDVALNPQRLDINFNHGEANFCHINSLDYIPEFDQIVMSSRAFDELWIIDHSTTTAQAATSSGGLQNKGGDLLYRWGNPAAYKAGTAADRRLFKQHDITYVKNAPNNGGNFLVFNNQITATESAAVEVNININSMGGYSLVPQQPQQPLDYEWTFQSDLIYSGRRSGAHRLTNGNTLITSFSGRTLTEISPNGSIVWRYEIDLESTFITGSSAFKVRGYDRDSPSLRTFNLEPLDPSDY